MIGNMEDAMRAVEDNLSGRNYIGAGMSRNVYVYDNVVYKVGCSNTNIMEHDNLNHFRDIADDVVIPYSTLYRVGSSLVLAMPYISGQLLCECYCCVSCTDNNTGHLTAEQNDIIMQYIYDTGGDNVVLTDTGDLVIIDFGEGVPGRTYALEAIA